MKKVLIIDDQSFLKMIKWRLNSEYSFDVRTVPSALGAFELFKT